MEPGTAILGFVALIAGGLLFRGASLIIRGIFNVPTLGSGIILALVAGVWAGAIAPAAFPMFFVFLGLTVAVGVTATASPSWRAGIGILGFLAFLGFISIADIAVRGTMTPPDLKHHHPVVLGE